MRPVFVISLPRSGSTLLQKMLAVSPKVATVAEPWICLPLAQMTEKTGMVAEYWHATCQQAIEDLAGELPGGMAEFRKLTGNYVQSIYDRIAGDSGAAVFMDKTPRYYLIVPFLAEAFPDAKFIFLFRNPVEVLASILRTWHHNRFGPRFMGNYVDIVRGPRDMANGYRMVESRAMAVNYQKLVSDTETTVREVCEYLEVPFEEDMLTKYRDVEFSGRMGDPVGVQSYGSVSTASLDKWKSFIRNPVRKRYVLNYLRDLGPDVLSEFGLDMEEMLRTAGEVKTGWSGMVTDAVGMRLLKRSLRENARSVGPRWVRKQRRKPLVPYG